MIATAPAIEPFLGKPEETEAQWFLGCQVWLRAGAAQTGGALAMIEQIVPVGLGSPYHIHHSEDEYFYILEGEIRFFSQGRTWVLGNGGFAFLPRGIAHGFRTEGDTPSRSLIFATPGGFEAFVAELSSPVPPSGPPDLAAVMAVAGRYGLEILGLLPE
jgi:quercetin dioxygenase-like cupin family protein